MKVFISILVMQLVGFSGYGAVNCENLSGDFVTICKQNKRILRKLRNVGGGPGRVCSMTCIYSGYESYPAQATGFISSNEDIDRICFAALNKKNGWTCKPDGSNCSNGITTENMSCD